MSKPEPSRKFKPMKLIIYCSFYVGSRTDSVPASYFEVMMDEDNPLFEIDWKKLVNSFDSDGFSHCGASGPSLRVCSDYLTRWNERCSRFRKSGVLCEIIYYAVSFYARENIE